MKFFNTMLIILLSITSLQAHSNSISALTSAKRTKEILELHQAFIQNPQSLVMLHTDISSLFNNSNPKYQGFNNELAQKLGLIKNLEFSGLNKVTFSSESLNGNPEQAYSVTFSEVSHKDCLALSGHPVNDMFIKVYINDNKADPFSCKKNWLFQKNKNKIKYIGR